MLRIYFLRNGCEKCDERYGKMVADIFMSREIFLYSPDEWMVSKESAWKKDV